jgi:hypothetical protein
VIRASGSKCWVRYVAILISLDIIALSDMILKFGGSSGYCVSERRMKRRSGK